MGRVEDVQLISGVWYNLVLPYGKSFSACCVIRSEGDDHQAYFEFPDESVKAASDLLPHLKAIEAMEEPPESSFHITDFLDDEEAEDLPMPE